jgi:hypothetical protein
MSPIFGPPQSKEREEMSKNHTRKFLEAQGYDFDDVTLRELGPWMRWPYVFCASILITGVALASPAILWTLAVIAGATVFLPSHPFNYLYNYVVRHLTGTRPLPPGTVQGRFACGTGSIMLVGIGYAFLTGAATVGYVLGGTMAAMATLVATTHICIPSLVYTALFGRKMVCVTQAS